MQSVHYVACRSTLLQLLICTFSHFAFVLAGFELCRIVSDIAVFVLKRDVKIPSLPHV